MNNEVVKVSNLVKYYDGQNPDEAPEPRKFIQQFHAPEIAVSRLIQVYREIESP